MEFPDLTDAARLQRLEPPDRPVRVVLDTDTYNEIDDQFAVLYAVRSPERIRLQALYTAPFLNERSTGPGDGIEKMGLPAHRVGRLSRFKLSEVDEWVRADGAGEASGSSTSQKKTHE